MVGLLPDSEPVRFLEPALGSGSFFSALAQQVKPSRIESAVGVELDHRLASLARDLWEEVGLKVVEGDFTIEYRNIQKANLLITNPPYVRHHHLGSESKSRLKSKALDASGLSVNGLSGLYVYFMALSHACMADGGIAAWLIPSEFMDVNYGGVLRQYLTHRVQLIRVHRFDPDDVQFDDALVSSAVRCVPEGVARCRCNCKLHLRRHHDGSGSVGRRLARCPSTKSKVDIFSANRLRYRTR